MIPSRITTAGASHYSFSLARKAGEFRKAGNWALLAENTARVFKQQSSSLLFDPISIKNNALIISALMLVTARIVLSNLAAVKAKGTPDENFRRTEAIKTSIREGGGWVLSYLFFRLLQRLTKRSISRAFYIQPRKELWRDLIKHLRTGYEQAFNISTSGKLYKHGKFEGLPLEKAYAFGFREKLTVQDRREFLINNFVLNKDVRATLQRKGVTLEQLKKLPLDTREQISAVAKGEKINTNIAALLEDLQTSIPGQQPVLSPEAIKEYYETKALAKVSNGDYLPRIKRFTDRVVGLVKRQPKDYETRGVDFVKSLYVDFPLAIGAVVSLVLSGYVLERYTRDYAVRTSEWLSNAVDERRTKKRQKELGREVKAVETQLSKQAKAAFPRTPVAHSPFVPVSNQTAGVASNIQTGAQSQGAGSSHGYEREYRDFLNSLSNV